MRLDFIWLCFREEPSDGKRVVHWFDSVLLYEGCQAAGLKLRVRFEPTTSRNHDFELKNGSGYYLEGLIAGARFEPTTYKL